jgi:hypothetical protein
LSPPRSNSRAKTARVVVTSGPYGAGARHHHRGPILHHPSTRRWRDG